MTNKQLIKEVTSKVLNVSQKDVQVSDRLMGGMSNFTYVISVFDQKYTFRIPGKKAELFVDRKVEQHHIELVTPLELNSEVIYLDIESGYKIAKYVEGTPLNELDVLNYLKEVANVLHQLHDQRLHSKYNYDPLKRLELYESYTFEYGFKHSERYQMLKQTMMKYAETLIDPDSYVFTHGDCQASNFVKTEDGMKLMDWEFSGNNDPMYDIACFGDFVYEYAIELLPVYLGRKPSLIEENKVWFYMAFQSLQWHNVAMYKEFIGLSVDLGVDFIQVAENYLDDATLFLSKIKD
jgi:thiamine kinase-like enzyme